MADLALKVGQTIEDKDGRQGKIQYIGPLEVAAGEWLGIVLPDSTGKNDGSVKGTRYFTCEPGHGIFIKREAAVNILKQPPPQRASGPATNGSAAKPRASSGLPPDVARKRQSLMSAGSAASTASRLSTRSPIKSPTKAVSSASSTASTPRTGTPATTARTSDSSQKSRLSTTGRQSMAPPPAPSKTTPAGGRASLAGGPRPSIGGGLSKSPPKPASSTSRQSLPASRLGARPSLPAKPQSRPARPTSASPSDADSARSPTIDEEDQEEPFESLDSRLQDPQPSPPAQMETSHAPQVNGGDKSRSRAPSISRSTAAAVESRTAEKKELEQLKARIRTMEKRDNESQEKLKEFDAIQTRATRFESIIQTLQKKMKVNQQEMANLKAQYEEAERRADRPSDRSAEHESELELANLDKEMAEERAQLAEDELEELRRQHEELQIKLELAEEENRELGSNMTSEEKAEAGFLAMQREAERLREALRMLRDFSQQKESELNGQVRELQETVDETQKTSSLFDEASHKLAREQETNKHLMEQLEMAEANDEIMLSLEHQREAHEEKIRQLANQISDLEERLEVENELEVAHTEEEKALNYQLDEKEALLNETAQEILKRDAMIEDLNYTLSKFREATQELQGEVDGLRRSRDIDEQQAHEMSSKSRAMMDLNLQLQNSAFKTQLKTIDFEMGKMHAEQAKSHLEIMQLFVPDSFDLDRNPVLSLLCFRRVKSKAALIKNILAERMRDRPHLAQDDPFAVYEVMEKMSWVLLHCNRFIDFISTCTSDEFSRFSGALYELEPVERSLTGWVDALKRDELGPDSPEFLQRMIGILQDLAEKLIVESNESKARELLAQSGMVESYTDSAALQLSALMKAAQDRLGPAKEDDDESLVFDKKTDQSATKARTIRYMASKVVDALSDLKANSMCLGETTWSFFEEAQRSSKQLAHLIREIGKAVVNELNKVEHEEPLTYHSLVSLMTSVAQSTLHKLDPNSTISSDTEVFTLLNSTLATLQSRIDDLQTKASDLSSSVEFESRSIPPWLARAKEIKAQKNLDRDTAEEVQRLKAKAAEDARILVERSRIVEEQGIRIEVLESRMKEGRAKDTEVKELKDDIARVEKEKADALTNLENTQKEMQELVEKRQSELQELETLRTATASGAAGIDPATAASLAKTLGDGAGEGTHYLRAEVECLQSEIANLQSTIRYLKQENHSLRVPVGQTALFDERNAWLDPSFIGLRTQTAKQIERARLQQESRDVLNELIDLVGQVKPVKLNLDTNARRKVGERWKTARQREEWEEWKGWRDDVVKRGKVELRSSKSSVAAASDAEKIGRPGQKPLSRAVQGKLLPAMGVPGKALDATSGGREVKIVDPTSPPR